MPSQPIASVFTPPQPIPPVFTLSQPVPSTISNQQPIQATQSPTVHPITAPYLSSGISQAPPASEDVHHATSAHFIQSASFTAQVISSSQPFLGFNKLSIDMTGQVNQCHLALAAVHLPHQPHLVVCGACVCWGGHQGPVVHPPSLPCGPSLDDCMYITTGANGNDTQMLHINAYIYPPEPLSSSRVSNVS